VHRWFAPVVIVLAVLVQASSFATAGIVNVVMCCCPSVDDCKCHEHDSPNPPTQLQRCGGAVDETPPILTAYSLPSEPAPRLVPERAIDIVHLLPIVSQADPLVPEKPPF
jgi:hypothetical protein